MKMADKSIRRLSATESNEYHPRWSPDGSVIAFRGDQARAHRSRDDDGRHARVGDERRRHEPSRSWRRDRQPAGRARVDRRRRAVMFTVQERGHVRLYRVPVSGGKPELVVNERGAVGAFSTAKDTMAYTFTEPVGHGPVVRRIGGTRVGPYTAGADPAPRSREADRSQRCGSRRPGVWPRSNRSRSFRTTTSSRSKPF